MKEISNNIKVLAFDKNEDEPLNDEEQALWEEWKSGRTLESLKINVHDPELFELIRLYNKWENNKAASWKSFEVDWLDDELPKPQPSPKPGHRKVYFMYAIAASVLLVLAATVLYYLAKEQPAVHVADTQTTTNAPLAVSDEPIQPAEGQPGGKRAMLTLADKTQRNLEKLAQGLIAYQNATAVKKESDGQIVYQVTNTHTHNEQPYNTLTTPPGGEYKVTLPDGSTAWLNAGSSLYYPIAFSGNERRVELTGEAYFEVKKVAGKPFKVFLNKQTSVQVKGTKFNINAYANNSISTTLIEGEVELLHNNKTIPVTQNQQAIISGDNIQLNKNINPESVIAWKNGFINFEGETVASILEQIGRWYSIKTKVIGHPKTSLTDKIPRYYKLEDVIQIISADPHTEFTLEKNILIAKEK